MVQKLSDEGIRSLLHNFFIEVKTQKDEISLMSWYFFQIVKENEQLDTLCSRKAKDAMKVPLDDILKYWRHPK